MAVPIPARSSWIMALVVAHQLQALDKYQTVTRPIVLMALVVGQDVKRGLFEAALDEPV